MLSNIPITTASSTVTIFHLDKYLLCRYSDRFSDIFKDPKSAHRTTFAFQDLDTEIFSVLANWLPNATLVNRNNQPLKIAELVQLWLMAESFEIATLQNNTVKEIYKLMDGDERVQPKGYLELWESGVELLRGLALEMLLRNPDSIEAVV